MSDKALELQFVSDWENWDELETGVFYFYNVKLKPDVFPFPIQEGVVYDLLVDVNNCLIEVYAVEEQDTPIFTSKFKAVLV